MGSFVTVDHGYSWIVLIGVAVASMIVGVQVGSLGIFVLEFVDYFNIKKSEAVLICGISQIVGPIGASLLCSFTVKLGPRITGFIGSLIMSFGYFLCYPLPYYWVVFVAFGIVRGIGTFVIFTQAMVVIPKYFDKKKSFASGMLAFGISLGVIIFPQITNILLELYGMRGAMLLFAGISLNGCVCAALFRPNQRTSPIPSDPKADTLTKQDLIKGESDQDNNPKIELQVKVANSYDERVEQIGCKNSNVDMVENNTSRYGKCMLDHVPFFIFLVGAALTFTGHGFVNAYTPLKAKEIGLSSAERSNLLSMIGLTGGFIRPFSGLLGNTPFFMTRRIYLYGVSSLIGGVLIALTITYTNYLYMSVYVCFYAVFSGTFISMQAAVYSDLVAAHIADYGGGLMTLSMGLGMLILNVIMGLMLEATDSTRIAAVMLGSIQACGGVLIISIPFIKHRLIQYSHKHSITNL